MSDRSFPSQSTWIVKTIQPNKVDGGADGTLAMNNRPVGSGLAICKHQIDKWAVILPSV